MAEILSIIKTNKELTLEANKSDYTAFALRLFGPLVAALTATGLMGPEAPAIAGILGNAISFVIPNQKIERVVIGLNVLADKLMFLGQDLDEEKLKTEEFMDLLEDGVLQFARALTPERRAYIANLLSTSLTDETLDHLAQKKLLAMLNQLNDAEIILLHFYAVRRGDKSKSDEMLKEYPFIQRALRAHEDDEPDEKELMFRGYRGTLFMASLIMGSPDDEYPSPMGYLLLKYVQPNKVRTADNSLAEKSE
jgi:hypothetical protein